jgi:hypothetical protein
MTDKTKLWQNRLWGDSPKNKMWRTYVSIAYPNSWANIVSTAPKTKKEKDEMLRILDESSQMLKFGISDGIMKSRPYTEGGKKYRKHKTRKTGKTRKTRKTRKRTHKSSKSCRRRSSRRRTVKRFSKRY